MTRTPKDRAKLARLGRAYGMGEVKVGQRVGMYPPPEYRGAGPEQSAGAPAPQPAIVGGQLNGKVTP